MMNANQFKMPRMRPTSRITSDLLRSLDLMYERSSDRATHAGTPSIPSQESGQIS